MGWRQHAFFVPFIGFRSFSEMRQSFCGLLCKDACLIIRDLISLPITIDPAIIAVFSIGELHKGLADLPAYYLEGGIKRPLHTLFPGLLPQILILQLKGDTICFASRLCLEDRLSFIEGKRCILRTNCDTINIGSWAIGKIGCEVSAIC